MANDASEQREKNKIPKYKEGDTFEGHATISINCGPRLPVARIRIISFSKHPMHVQKNTLQDHVMARKHFI